MTDKTIQQLCDELTAATREFNEAEKKESWARSETTICKNRLNQAQKALEARMTTLAKDAPRDSDWGQRRFSGKPVSGTTA